MSITEKIEMTEKKAKDLKTGDVIVIDGSPCAVMYDASFSNSCYTDDLGMLYTEKVAHIGYEDVKGKYQESMTSPETIFVCQ